MIYQWKIPNRYDVPAQEAGMEIDSCKNGEGFITPEAVVKKAKIATSVIHGCFEWDDANAAVRYRLYQAGELIRNIVSVNIEDDCRVESPVRAFVNIKGESERGYKPITAVIHNPSECEYMLECAKNELRAFAQKYASLEELRGLIAAIREVLT